MRKEKVVLNGRELEIHELLAVEEDEIIDKNLTKNSERTREYVKRCANISDEDYNKLTSSERLELIRAMNRVNGWDFQNPEKKDSGMNSA